MCIYLSVKLRYVCESVSESECKVLCKVLHIETCWRAFKIIQVPYKIYKVFWCLMYKAIQEDKKNKHKQTKQTMFFVHAFLPNQRLECVGVVTRSEAGCWMEPGPHPVVAASPVEPFHWSSGWKLLVEKGDAFVDLLLPLFTNIFVMIHRQLLSYLFFWVDHHWSDFEATVQPWEQRGALARFHPRPPKTGVQSHGTCQTRSIENTWKYNQMHLSNSKGQRELEMFKQCCCMLLPCVLTWAPKKHGKNSVFTSCCSFSK